MYGMKSPKGYIYENEESINPLAYGVGKAGVIQYTKYAAMMLAKNNITVNSVSFGPFPNKEKVKDEEFLDSLSSQTFFRQSWKS